MADFAPDAFTLFFNCNQDRKTQGAYWASAEIPLDQIRAMARWAEDQAMAGNTVTSTRGDECVMLRANLRPKVSKAGNDYLMLIISDQKPKTEEMPF